MDFSKFKNKLLICLFCIVIILPFYLITFTYGAENVDSTLVSGLDMAPNRNYFASTTSHSVRYITIEKGYIYSFTNTGTVYSTALSFSNEVPAVNVPYYDYRTVAPGESFQFISSDYNYLYFNGMDTDFLVTREKVPGQDSAVNDLVNNVGIGQIWGVFDISINYIVIVVLVAFGIYIIFRIIRKISRGKEGL